MVVMQYIGINDKYGKEIYEGDVVKYAGWVDMVIFGLNGACFSLVDIVSHETDLSVITDATSQHIEVVGNKFETPELIPQ